MYLRVFVISTRGQTCYVLACWLLFYDQLQYWLTNALLKMPSGSAALLQKPAMGHNSELVLSSWPQSHNFFTGHVYRTCLWVVLEEKWEVWQEVVGHWLQLHCESGGGDTLWPRHCYNPSVPNSPYLSGLDQVQFTFCWEQPCVETRSEPKIHFWFTCLILKK
jgi:hypothetical protein